MEPGPSGSGPPPLPRPGSSGDWRAVVAHWRELVVDRASMSKRLRTSIIGLAATTLIVALLVATATRSPSPPLEGQLPVVEPEALPTPTTPADNRAVVVHVAGAGHHPGLVVVDADARVADAITAAGGATDDADLDRVNLAAVVRDADRIAVPRVGEEPPSVVEQGVTDDAPVNVNSATAVELEALPGVGPAIASAIVAHREEHGPFASVAELEQVAGIGPSKLAALSDRVVAR